MKTYNNDNGGRRSGIERRLFTYAGCLPERRVENDRRNEFDRRNGSDRRRPRLLDGIAGEDRRKRFSADREKNIFIED